MIAAVTASWRLSLFLLWSVFVIAVQSLCLWLRLPVRQTVPFLWHKGVCRIIGIRFTLLGQRSKVRPTLFVSNHASYLDIVTLGARLPAQFVSKREVADWPLFGTLAKVGNTLFIERNPRLAREHQEDMADVLENRRSLILFPEGTSGDGNRVLPFKSTLFSVGTYLQKKGVQVMVQPVTVAYTTIDGMPLRRVHRPQVAWYGDMAMGSHLWRLMGLGKVGVTITFHEPRPLDSFVSRKDASAWSQQQVALGLKASYTGRNLLPVPVSADA
jgi:lyso-ornithine lipid O-acyltransferase